MPGISGGTKLYLENAAFSRPLHGVAKRGLPAIHTWVQLVSATFELRG